MVRRSRKPVRPRRRIPLSSTSTARATCRPPAGEISSAQAGRTPTTGAW
uniref:Uncharacterized protein n=1 Tax=Arundo donax TaxID=35708 RepID=A0A0A9H7V7_ARUDO